MRIISIKHSFNSGDAITILPGLQHLFKTKGIKIIFYQVLNFEAYYYDNAVHPIVNLDGKHVTMNEKQWEMLKPLLESQEYIERAEIWQGENVAIDFDISRDRKSIPMPSGLIHFWPFAIAPELQCDLSVDWINFNTIKLSEKHFNITDKVIINRTERYQNPYIHYYFLKQYENQLIFAGTEKEHEVFLKKWNIYIPRLIVNDFLELAMAIKSAKGFIGNQSFCWHLADAQKVNRILELCPQFPNTFPTGANGKAFLYQNPLEMYVSELFNIIKK